MLPDSWDVSGFNTHLWFDLASFVLWFMVLCLCQSVTSKLQQKTEYKNTMNLWFQVIKHLLNYLYSTQQRGTMCPSDWPLCYLRKEIRRIGSIWLNGAKAETGTSGKGVEYKLSGSDAFSSSSVIFHSEN